MADAAHAVEIEAEFPEALAFLFEMGAYRYKVPYGGRGGTKSWGIARALLIMGTERKLRILCTREFQNSIKQSVHKLLKDQIDRLGLGDRYNVQEQTIVGTNGTEFIFAGLRHNLESIKSMEGIDICWVEEAQTISQLSMDILHPTIRKEGSEIWYSFNPRLATDPVFKFFIGDNEEKPNPPPNACVRKVGIEDNPWASDVLLQDRDNDYARDPEKAAWVWGGKTIRVTEAQVLRGRWRVEEFEPKKTWSGPHHGLDFGFATSPMAGVELYINDAAKELYLYRESSGLNVDIDDMPGKLDEDLPLFKENQSKADSARPDLIKHLQRHEFVNVQPCYKFTNSIMAGVDHLRDYKAIIIHPSCTLAIEQALLYSFETDRLTGEVKKPTKPVDKDNDIWDACRYALETIIMNGLRKKKKPPKTAPLARDYRGQRTIGRNYKTR